MPKVKHKVANGQNLALKQRNRPCATPFDNLDPALDTDTLHVTKRLSSLAVTNGTVTIGSKQKSVKKSKYP